MPVTPTPTRRGFFLIGQINLRNFSEAFGSNGEVASVPSMHFNVMKP